MFDAENNPAQAALLEKMTAELAQKGPLHFLEWIDSWYPKAQAALLRDSFDLPANVPPSKQMQARALERLLNVTSFISNKSTLAGANLMKVAEVEALRSFVGMGMVNRAVEAVTPPEEAAANAK